MSLEELWELFPIVLSPHRQIWADWAETEISHLSEILAPYSAIFSHIGSTAIPEIKAKPIIDILVEISSGHDWETVKQAMQSNGYICMSHSNNRMSFNKGYTPAGYADKVFHIHFHAKGDNDEVFFRNYLITHPDVAKQYEDLKISLLPKYKNNRDGYTAAKSAFIRNICSLNKQANNH